MKFVAFYNQYIGRTIAILGTVCATSAFLYGALLLMTVSHAAAATNAEREIQTLTGKLGQLEGSYLAQTRALTPEYAQTLGFERPVVASVVYADSAVLSLNENAVR